MALFVTEIFVAGEVFLNIHCLSSPLSTVIVISMLRTYALYQRNKKILFLLIGTAVTCAAAAFVSVEAMSYLFDLNEVVKWATMGENSDVSISMGCNFAEDRIT